MTPIDLELSLTAHDLRPGDRVRGYDDERVESTVHVPSQGIQITFESGRKSEPMPTMRTLHVTRTLSAAPEIADLLNAYQALLLDTRAWMHRAHPNAAGEAKDLATRMDKVLAGEIA